MFVAAEYEEGAGWEREEDAPVKDVVLVAGTVDDDDPAGDADVMAVADPRRIFCLILARRSSLFRSAIFWSSSSS